MSEYAKKDFLQISILNRQQLHDAFHLDAQLFYLLEGTMQVAVREYTTNLKAEDVLVINANKEYQYHASADLLLVRISIPTQLISRMVQSADVVFWCDSSRENNRRYDELRKALRQLLHRYLGVRDRGEDFGYYALCYQVLDILSNYFLMRLVDREGVEDTERFENRILQIDNYIQANYDRPISSKDLAEKLYLSQGYLSRFFKRNYNMSFAEYLTGIRLYHAMDDLVYTTKPITRVAYDNGFANTAAFNKAFKDKYGRTPSVVRQELSAQKKEQARPAEDETTEQRLAQYLQQEGMQHTDDGEAGHRTVTWPARAVERLAPVWDTINAGAAVDLLKSEVREHLLMLADQMGFTYVRFWNLFSREMLLDLHTAEQSYNFSKLDSILDFLLEHNLKPHMELGSKPRRLYRNVQTAIEQDPLDQPLPEPEVWEPFLHALMRHLQRRYHAGELDGWRMEVWFNESLRGNPEASCDYLAFFNSTASIVRQYASGLQIGGCGLRPGYDDEEQTLEFLRAWRQQPYLPDFLSALCYAYERGQIHQDRYSRRSTDNEYLLHRVEELRTLLDREGFGDTPLWLTEWNLTVSDRNFINDTCFKGAYVVKNAIDAYGMTQRMAYFLGSDRVSEHYDSGMLLYGGTGLLTKDSILKPAGHAFRFLHMLFPYFVGKEENCLATTDGHGGFALLCHNQKELNHNYYLSREDEIQRDCTWKYYEDRTPLQLTVGLEGIADGSYQIKIYQVGLQAGSVLEAWAEMEYQPDLSRHDIQYLQRVCGPKLTIRTAEAEQGVLNLDIELQANEIRLLHIRPIH